MGKSYKKHSIHGIAGGSDKQDKRIANRRLRSKVKQKLKDYDEGKKEISTTDVERHLRDLQPTT